MRHIIWALVDNQPGVLVRVAGLVSRRGFNIESLSVGPTHDKDLSRLTMVVEADDISLEQITKQLNKLISVHKITDITDSPAIIRELVLFRVDVAPEQRSEITEIINIFRAKIVDVGATTMAIEVTGDEEKVNGLASLLEPYGIKETVRTGIVVLPRNIK